MRNQIRRKIGFILVIAMLIVMIYPGESGSASEESNGFRIENNVILDYVGAENAVVIPDGIVGIGDSAFQGTTITSVSIPSSVTSIGNYAFASCYALVNVSIPETVTSVGVAAFSGCSSLGSVEWRSSAGVPDNAFSDCVGLTSVSLSNGISSIGSEAFKNCISLSSIAIPSATNSIASNAFDGCTNMTAINVAGDNAFYTTYDGVLYTTNGVSLIRCPQGKTSINVHSNTQSIESNAFYGCKIGTVSLPAGVTTVKLNAFTGSEIQTLILQANVSVFEAQAFTIYCIQVPGAAPVTPELIEVYGEIVITDYVPPQPSTETPATETPNQPTPGTENSGDPTPSTENPGESGTENSGDPTPGTETVPDVQLSDNGEPSVPISPMDNLNLENGQRQDVGKSHGQDMGIVSDGGSNGNSGGDGGAANGTSGGNSGTAKGNPTGNSSGSGSKTGNSGSTGSTGGKVSGNGTAKTETTGVPYIVGNKEIQGWEKINAAFKSGKDHETFHINMNGTTVVPANALSNVHNKKLTIVLDMGDGITWTLKGEDIVGENLKETDFGVSLGAGSVPQELQSDVADESFSTQLKLAYDGVFGFTAVLKVNLGRSAAGYNATLYYYNEEDNKMEYIDKELVKDTGDVSFTFAHASDYVIVINGLSPEDADMTALGAHVKDDTPKTGPGLNAKYILCLGIMLLGIYMMLTSKKEPGRKIA